MASTIESVVAPGITYRTYIRDFGTKYSTRIHVLFVDLSTPYLKVKPCLAMDTIGRLQRTCSIGYWNRCIAAINGSFFDRSRPHLPVGLLVIDGKIITKCELNRSAIGINGKDVKFGIPKFTGYIENKASKDRIAIWGLNRPRKEDEAIIYTPEFGPRTKTNTNGMEIIVEDNMVTGISDGNSPIPDNGYVISFHGWTKDFANELPPGSSVEAFYKLDGGWENYPQVISGGPRLLENGKDVVLESIDKENFDGEVFGKHARTAIGLCGKSRLALVVAEGRSSRRKKRRRGINYLQLTTFMKDIGCSDAIGLDGGGSSAMYVTGKTEDYPADGSQPGVSNALIVRFEP